MKALWNKFTNWLNTGNHLLWSSIIVLMVIGLISMYFIGPYQEARTYYYGPNFFFGGYWPYVLIGLLFMFGCSRLSKKAIIRISWIWGIIAFLLLVVTIITPHMIAGASRYAFPFGIPVNPYIMMLPAYIVLMSHWLSKENTNKTWTTIGTTALTLFIVWAAIIAPYIFIAQVYLLLFIIMSFKARKNIPSVFYISIGFLLVFAAMFGLALLFYPELQHRILIVNMGNYATRLSVDAITSSALIGNTPESLIALSRIPNATTDFMFTGIVAKFGILTGLLTLMVYGAIAKCLVNIIQNTKDKFNNMLATGALGLLAIFILSALVIAFGFVSIAAYWPLISFGATAFLAWSLLFGFILAGNKTK